MNRLVSIALIALITAATSAAVAAPPDRRKPVRSLVEFRQAGVVMQKWDISCGAAALATVLTYHFGDPVSERTIAATMLRRNDPDRIKARGGFSFLDLKRFAEARGYTAAAYRQVGLRDLGRFDHPIVPIATHAGSHFVVLRALTGDRVDFADPAFGNRTMTVRSFQKSWLGGMAFVVTAPPAGCCASGEGASPGGTDMAIVSSSAERP
jgi:predicted double-glycine peptidase